MGSKQSKYFDECSSDDIARGIAELGPSYEGCAQDCRDNGVDGYLLIGLSDTELAETMDDLGINDRLHRRVLERILKDAIAFDEEPAWELLDDEDDLGEVNGMHGSCNKAFNVPETKILLEFMTSAAEEKLVVGLSALREKERACKLKLSCVLSTRQHKSGVAR